MELRLPEETEILKGVAPVITHDGQGPDGCWRQCHLGPDDVKIFSQEFWFNQSSSEIWKTGHFVPKSEKFFLGKDTNNIELWLQLAWSGKNSKKIEIKSRQGFVLGLFCAL